MLVLATAEGNLIAGAVLRHHLVRLNGGITMAIRQRAVARRCTLERTLYTVNLWWCGRNLALLVLFRSGAGDDDGKVRLANSGRAIVASKPICSRRGPSRPAFLPCWRRVGTSDVAIFHSLYRAW